MWIPANIAALAYFTGASASTVAAPLQVGGGNSWIGALALIGVFGLLLFALNRMGAAWLLGRLASHAGTLLAATVVVFVVLQILPGDPAAYMMGMNASPESIASAQI